MSSDEVSLSNADFALLIDTANNLLRRSHIAVGDSMAGGAIRLARMGRSALGFIINQCFAIRSLAAGGRRGVREPFAA
jgi:hypothetical protein